MQKYFLNHDTLTCALDGIIPKSGVEINMNGIEYYDYCNEPERYEIQDGILFDISNTTDYIEKKELERKTKRIETIRQILIDLDLKTIRAIREGGYYNESGTSYLEIYQNQIESLRLELKELESEVKNVQEID